MTKHSLQIYLPPDCPQDASSEIGDVVTLYHQEQWDQLNNTVICRDECGNITAKFGDAFWRLDPWLMTKNCTHKRINFAGLKTHPELLNEFRLICYGWLFTPDTRYSSQTKVSTIISRASGLKKTYHFLIQNALPGLSALNESANWQKYLLFLQEQKMSAGTLVHILCALQQACRLFQWMRTEPMQITINPTQLSQALCRPEAMAREQTLAIPEALADKLLQRAVHLVESAWPFRTQLADTERLLQENYDAGKEIVREKINGGQWKWLGEEGNLDSRRQFAKETHSHAPERVSRILANQLADYPLYEAGADGLWWHHHRAGLMAAGFICCAAFSGMRESELFELTPDSYYHATYHGRTFHFLKARTHKTGERHTEWVVAPVVQKAVELIASVTAHMRQFLIRNARTPREEKWAHCLWLSQGQRSTQPKRISTWCTRLSNFARDAGIVVSEADYKDCLRSNPNSLNKIRKFVHPGQPWLITPHQFRRTLAFFTIKNRLGNAIAIRQQFKHLYLQMSEWYCEGGLPSRLEDIESDKEFQTMIDTIHCEQITQKYWSWLHGNEVLAGTYGKDMLQLRGDLPVIYSTWDKLYRLVKEKRLTLHGTLHSYCKNGYDCDMGGVTNPAFCVECASHGSIITKEQALWWHKKHTSLTRYLTENPDASAAILTHCMTQIRAAEKVMADFSVAFEPWAPPTGQDNDG